jgi:propionate CoA-transferase
LQITQEGAIRKLVQQVGRICYDPAGRARCRTPLVITERAVMRLSHTGLEVTEIAPGIDLQRDVLEQAGFALTVSPGLRPMPATVFSSGEVTAEFVS